MNGRRLFGGVVLATGLATAGQFPDVTLNLAEGGKVGTRAYADVPVGAGACLKGALSFDVEASDPAVVDRFVCYVQSGKGWYRTTFEPTKDDMLPNRSYRVTLSTAEILATEGAPEGWRKADRVRFAAYRVSAKPSVVRISNLAFEPAAKEVVFVRNGAQKESDAPYVDNMRNAFAALGIPSMSLDQNDLADGGLDGTKLAVIAYAPSLSKACVDELVKFVAKGGKVFAAYSAPARVARLVGVKVAGHHKPSEAGLSPLAGFARGTDPLAGQPDFSPQASWMCTRAMPFEDAKVAAWWRTRDGKVTDIPGLVVSPTGIYVSHVWLGAAEGPSLELFAAAVETALPGTLAKLAAARAAETKRMAEVRAKLAAMPGKPGERRLIWCHSAWGMGEGHDWDSSCRFVKENGFTDLLVNLAWGGCAFYPSKVLPRSEKGPRGDALEACRAACRKYGIKMHVWKVCWNQGSSTPASFTEELKKAGRVCVTRSGAAEEKWNCPSDPENQKLEIDAMTELALEKGVDGIHFDYIRYGHGNVCFCDGCRTRFEAQIGRKVAKWPQDTNEAGPLYDAWNRFRCGNVTAVVKAVAEKVKKVRPETEISAAVFRDQDVTGVTVGQDWVPWCRAGWLDFVCPMDYIERLSRFAACIRSQREALKGLPTKLYPGLAFECSHYRGIGPLVPALEIEAVREAGLEGFAVFSLSKSSERILPELRKGPLKE